MRATTLQRNKALRGNATGALGNAKKVTGRLALAVVVVSLAACTAPGDQATVHQTTEAPAAGEQAATQATAKPSAKPSAPAAATKDASAATAALQRTMAVVLESVVAANPKPATADITSALTAAGVPARSLEVSAGRTPTGLEVDSMEAAAVQAKECVIGQIRDGKVTVTLLPALSNGKCFVGAAG
ncbi:DUF6993 domain-containing protein [Arthrobacter sp. SAFR-014]|uniref:DUF6993 domain-containing protein n=1 Tax=unclassified Arthrobacter TaxID=235627 RepID=UPI003F7C8F7B